MGSSAALSLPKPADSVAAVWKIDDVVDDTVDLIDSDQLLDEEDLKKPDAASLKGKKIVPILILYFFLTMSKTKQKLILS